MKKIVVVDDQLFIREKLRHHFTNKGFIVEEFDSGEKLVNELAKHMDAAIILLDFHMPGMNGIVAFEKFKIDNPNLKIPPTVMLTTEAQMGLKAKAKQLGIRGWITKPFNLDSIEGVIKKIT